MEHIKHKYVIHSLALSVVVLLGCFLASSVYASSYTGQLYVVGGTSGTTTTVTLGGTYNYGLFGHDTDEPVWFDTRRECKGLYPTCDIEVTSSPTGWNNNSMSMSMQPWIGHGPTPLSLNGTGNYWWEYCTEANYTGECVYYQFALNVENETVDISYVDNGESRIIELLPEQGTTTPSGVPVDVYLKVYVDADDADGFFTVKVNLTNVDQNTIIPIIYDIYYLQDTEVSHAGYYEFASSTLLADGNYRIEAEIVPYWAWGTFSSPELNQYFGVPFVDAGHLGGIRVTHSYVVGAPTWIGTVQNNIWEVFYNQQLATTTGATTTAQRASGSVCNPFSGNFAIANCLVYLFIPSQDNMLWNAKALRNAVLSKWPIGYVSDLVDIFTTTATSSLPVIDATLPIALGLGSGHHIYLSLDNVLDPIFNATTSVFVNESAPDTRSFFDITYDYWKIAVYIGTIFYILRRILGNQTFGIAVIKNQAKTYYKKS